MRLREELYTELGKALLAEQVKVLDYRGEGFLAAARGRDHGKRALRGPRLPRHAGRVQPAVGRPGMAALAGALRPGNRAAAVGAARHAAARRLDGAGRPVRVVSRLLGQTASDDVVLGPHLRAASAPQSTIS